MVTLNTAPVGLSLLVSSRKRNPELYTRRRIADNYKTQRSSARVSLVENRAPHTSVPGFLAEEAPISWNRKVVLANHCLLAAGMQTIPNSKIYRETKVGDLVVGDHFSSQM